MQNQRDSNLAANVNNYMVHNTSKLLLCIFLASCGKTSPVQMNNETCSSDKSCVVSTQTVDTIFSEHVIDEFNNETTSEPHPTIPLEPLTKVHISKEYQEGYDAGYDDGEDDALSKNGYEGQYDDSCRYKGKKRKDYQLRYAEGYEAGFYDHVSDNGDDDEYE